MARGGKRENAGRKAGEQDRIHREAKERAIATGQTPLEYMLEVMRNSVDPNVKLDAAKAAAPYIHPRLNAIQGGDKPVAVKHTVSWANPEE